jgi:hypothetical protein
MVYRAELLYQAVQDARHLFKRIATHILEAPMLEALLEKDEKKHKISKEDEKFLK